MGRGGHRRRSRQGRRSSRRHRARCSGRPSTGLVLGVGGGGRHRPALTSPGPRGSAGRRGGGAGGGVQRRDASRHGRPRSSPTGVPFGLVLSARPARSPRLPRGARVVGRRGRPWGIVPERVAIAAGPDGWLSPDGLDAYGDVWRQCGRAVGPLTSAVWWAGLDLPRAVAAGDALSGVRADLVEEAVERVGPERPSRGEVGDDQLVEPGLGVGRHHVAQRSAVPASTGRARVGQPLGLGVGLGEERPGPGAGDLVGSRPAASQRAVSVGRPARRCGRADPTRSTRRRGGRRCRACGRPWRPPGSAVGPDRLRLAQGVGQPVVLAGDVVGRLAQQAADDLDGLPEGVDPLARRGQVDAVLLVLVDLPPGAEAEDEAARRSRGRRWRRDVGQPPPGAVGVAVDERADPPAGGRRRPGGDHRSGSSVGLDRAVGPARLPMKWSAGPDAVPPSPRRGGRWRGPRPRAGWSRSRRRSASRQHAPTAISAIRDGRRGDRRDMPWEGLRGQRTRRKKPRTWSTNGRAAPRRRSARRGRASRTSGGRCSGARPRREAAGRSRREDRDARGHGDRVAAPVRRRLPSRAGPTTWPCPVNQ